MTRKIFGYMTVISFLCLLLSLGISLWGFSGYYAERLQKELREDANHISGLLNRADDDEVYLREYSNSFPGKRVSLIDTDGNVIYDNNVSAGTLDNHRDRPEVAEAALNGAASSERFSITLGTEVYYYAVRLGDGKILRMASVSYSVRQLAKQMAVPLGVLFVLIFALSVFLSSKLTRHILKPVEMLDIDNPEDAKVYDELVPFLDKIRIQKNEIKEQSRRLEKKKEQLAALTGNMREGLLILNKDAEIVSINLAAAKIFNADISVTGENILHLTRDMELIKAAKDAVGGIEYQLDIEKNGKVYRVFLSPVYRDGQGGAVILFLDVTETVRAEQIRREFSANVSHELKTPLTGLLGYSQMLGNGMVKEDDVRHFAKKIEEETGRIVKLVDDIIKQSRLDEGNSLEKQPVDLFELVKITGRRFSEKAKKDNISIDIQGTSAYVYGNYSMLEELIFNLAENAIKYNKASGSVIMSVDETDDERVFVSVEDTGVGIPSEELSRIYERFYRADKSHSGKIEGTGLGLSIVKHIARLHNAEIKTESRVGQGTKISVYFPGMR